MLLLFGALFVQVDADAVRRLGDPDVAVREQATSTLKQLSFELAGDLHTLADRETDPELRGRLLDVVRHLAGKESDALYQQGRLYASLLKLAESEGAADPATEVALRSQAARDFLQQCVEAQNEPGCRIQYPSSQMASFRAHGRYMLRPLMEALGRPPASLAFHVLTHAVSDPVPALCGLLRGEELPSSQGACHVLGWFADGRAVAMLRSVRTDPSHSEDLRRCATDVLRNTRVYPESCYSEVIERLVWELVSDDPAARDRATAALEDHPPGIVEQLRELAKGVTDPDQGQRLEAVIRHLDPDAGD